MRRSLLRFRMGAIRRRHGTPSTHCCGECLRYGRAFLLIQLPLNEPLDFSTGPVYKHLGLGGGRYHGLIASSLHSPSGNEFPVPFRCDRRRLLDKGGSGRVNHLYYCRDREIYGGQNCRQMKKREGVNCYSKIYKTYYNV